VSANSLAGAAVASMLYVDAIVADEGPVPADAAWVRPSACLWMSDAAYARQTAADRVAWRTAASGGTARRAVGLLLQEWGTTHQPWYGDNSRETLRDETFADWLGFGAIRDKPGLPTTSSKPRWALTATFADLFAPTLTEPDLFPAIDTWRERRMNPGDRFRIQIARLREQQTHAVTINLPGGVVRNLAPGEASVILKGVVEQRAPSRLADPVVLTISEPGDKVYVADAQMLQSLKLTIDPETLLPDAVIVDIKAKPPTFWIVEAVATAGPVTEDRRHQLLEWAADQRLAPGSCRFLSAFISRGSAPARKHLRDLAGDTYAWYADEPSRELAWYEIERAAPEGTDD